MASHLWWHRLPDYGFVFGAAGRGCRAAVLTPAPDSRISVDRAERLPPRTSQPACCWKLPLTPRADGAHRLVFQPIRTGLRICSLQASNFSCLSRQSLCTARLATAGSRGRDICRPSLGTPMPRSAFSTLRHVLQSPYPPHVRGTYL